MLYDVHGNVLSWIPSNDEIRRGAERYIALSSMSSARATSYGDFNEFPMYFMHPGAHGRLSYNELRSLYETSSSVRPAVDAITRELYGIPWQIIYKDHKYHSGKITDIITNIFNNINFDNEDFGTVASKFTNDLIVIGKGVMEKVRNVYGQLVEIRACDAAYFYPMVDPETQMISGYKELLPNSSKKGFRIHSKDDIIYRSFATISYSLSPLPIIETIINEIALLMLTVKNIGAAFSNDDVPPGVLHLGSIGEDALKRAQASFKETKDISQRGFTIKVVDNVDKVQWVQFTRPFREMQLAELVPIIERIVARNFGLAAVDAGLDGGGKTSTAVGQESARAKMFVLIMNMIQTIVNNEILPELYGQVKFIYNAPNLNQIETEKNLLSQMRLGLITINEFRLSAGRPPIQGGDQRFVLLGNEFVPLDPVTGLPQYRLDLFGPGRPSSGEAEEKPKEEKPEGEAESENTEDSEEEK